MLTRRLTIAAALTSAAALLAACGSETGTPETSAAPSTSASVAPSGSASASPSASASASKAKVPVSEDTDDIKVRGAYGREPKVTFKAPFAINKTQTRVLEPNDDGAEVKDGQTVEVNYYGVNGRTGKKFDDSFSRGQTVAFPLDGVVPGFKKGLLGQQQGSRVLIAMPGPDGYDASGGSPDAGIQVGDTLLFVVDVVGVQLEGPEGEEVEPADGLPEVSGKLDQPKVTVPKGTAPKTLQIQPLIKGEGKKVAATDTVTFDYQWLNASGKILEQSYGAAPATSELSGLLSGMRKGMVNQTVGSRVLLVIPPAEGYPDGNASPKVNKGETLVILVDILFTQAAQ